MATAHPSEARYRGILATRRPGESIPALARRAGVNVRTLYWWRWKLRRREQPPTKPPAPSQEPALIPIGLVQGLASGPGATDLEVALRRSGHVVRVPATFEAESLRRLVDVLEGR